MAVTYTLEEAADRLGLAPDEFKRRLRDDWKTVRSFRDGATLRFRSADIDELARTLGQASDPGVPLGESGPLSDSSDELVLQPPSKSGAKKPKAEQPVYLGEDSDDIFALPTDNSGKPKSKPKAKGDSDVRLDLTPPKRDPDANQPTEEISLDLGPPSSGKGLGKSGSKLTGPKSSGRLSSGAKIPSQAGADDGSSEFELSLDSDSDSFELQLTHDSSEEEVPLGLEEPTGPPGAKSGINLGRPADGGVSIEKKKGKGEPDSDSDIDFELSLDGAGGNGGPKSGRSLSTAPPEDGSSEFELSLDDSSGSESMNTLASSVQQEGDIFETDFELPAIADDESGSEVMSVDSSDTDLENSDFDLAISDADAPAADEESASEVVLMDGEEPATLDGSDMEVVDDPRAKPKGRNRLVDDEFAAEVEDEPVRTVAAPARWGLLPVLTLAPTFFVAILGGIMAFELVRGMAGYQQPSAGTAPLVRGVAGMFGMKTGD